MSLVGVSNFRILRLGICHSLFLFFLWFSFPQSCCDVREARFVPQLGQCGFACAGSIEQDRKTKAPVLAYRATVSYEQTQSGLLASSFTGKPLYLSVTRD